MTNENVQTINSTSIQITREIAKKVLDTIDAGLVNGVGDPTPGQMCVEAAVCFALNLPHGDDPGCVDDSLRSLKIRLNDSAWSSPSARARGLRRLGVAQLGSKGVLDGPELAKRVARLVITKHVAEALRAAASIHKDSMHQVALNTAAEKCESRGDSASCLTGCDAAWRAADADVDARLVALGAEGAASEAYDSIVDEDANSCVGLAVNAARKAAEAKSNAVAKTHAGTSHPADAYDQSLGDFAEGVVKILIEMRAPGCEWLDLTEAA